MPPKPLAPAQLDHVEIFVPDVDRAAAFWQPLLEALGHRCERWEGGSQRGLNAHPAQGPYLCFVQAPAAHAGAGFHRQRPGLNHLAFRLESPEAVAEVAAWAIAELGATPCYGEGLMADGDWRLAFFEDPMRLKVELKAPVAGA